MAGVGLLSGTVMLIQHSSDMNRQVKERNALIEREKKLEQEYLKQKERQIVDIRERISVISRKLAVIDDPAIQGQSVQWQESLSRVSLRLDEIVGIPAENSSRINQECSQIRNDLKNIEEATNNLLSHAHATTVLDVCTVSGLLPVVGICMSTEQRRFRIGEEPQSVCYRALHEANVRPTPTLHEPTPVIIMPTPDTTIIIDVCSVSGLLPNPGVCTSIVKRRFNLGKAPESRCTEAMHGEIVKNTPTPYTGPSSDTIIWNGGLDANEKIDLGDKLPGVPIVIESIEPQCCVNAERRPSPTNMWRVLVIRSTKKVNSAIIVKWRIL